MIDRSLQLSSLAGALLVFCGVSKLMIFYSAFGIEIVEFLTFSEIITTFLDDINLLFIFLLVLLVQSVPLINFIQRKSKLSPRQFYKQVDKMVFPRRYWYVGFFITSILILAWMLAAKMIVLDYWNIYLLLFFLVQALTYIGLHKNENGSVELSLSGKAFAIILTATAAILLLAFFDIQKVYASNRTVKVTTSHGLIVCNASSNKRYLGKTDNYLFLRNLESNSTRCIPISEIKDIEFIKH